MAIPLPPTPATPADHEAVRRQVNDAFAQLPKASRLAYLLAEDPGLSLAEAAAVLNTDTHQLLKTHAAVRRLLRGVIRRAQPHRPA